MVQMTMIEAIRSAMDICMDRDDDVVVFGEDVGYFGGVFRCTAGLQKKYGTSRVFDSPINESGIVGAGIGMAVYGLRPCVECSSPTISIRPTTQIVSEAARIRYRSAGDFTVPITIRSPCGGGISAVRHTARARKRCSPTFRVSRRSFPRHHTMQGIADRGHRRRRPGHFLEPKRLYNGPFDGYHDRPAQNWTGHPLGEVPEGHYTLPIGKAALRREGGEVTIVTYGTMCFVAEAAVADSGVDAEIIDLRTLLPLDIETIAASVNKTGRCMILHEATLTSGFGAELVSQVQEHCFYSLEAPIERVTGWGHDSLSACARVGLFPGTRTGGSCAQITDGGRVMGLLKIKMPDVGRGNHRG